MDNKEKFLIRDKQTETPAKDRKTQITCDLRQTADGDNYSVFVPKGHSRAKEIRTFLEQVIGEKTTLAGRNIRFDKDRKRGILIDDMLVPFRSSSFQSRVARILLQRPPGKRVSWDQMYDHELMGFDDISSELAEKDRALFKRKITDAVDAINKKVQQLLNTDDTLFYRDNNEIFWHFIRNF